MPNPNSFLAVVEAIGLYEAHEYIPRVFEGKTPQNGYGCVDEFTLMIPSTSFVS